MRRILLFLYLASRAAELAASEPRALMVGVWPNRLRLFDEATMDFVEEFALRHGAVILDSSGYSRTAHSNDRRVFYFITDRLEGVEIVDVARRAVVGTVKLSTPRRPVRILGVAASPGGERLYLLGRAIAFETDRYLLDSEVEIFVYDVSAREVTSTFPLPESVRYSTFPELRTSPQGDVLFALGDEIYEIGLDSHAVDSVIPLSRQSAPGYGAPGSGLLFYENDPGNYYAAYQTREPVLERQTTGILRLDLAGRQLSGFDLGPGMNVAHIALSPDGRTAYLGDIDLVAVDMRSRRILRRKEGIERGRTNTSWIVSGDGTKLYVSGVGGGMKIYNTTSLELIDEISFGADVLFAPFVLPRELLDPASE